MNRKLLGLLLLSACVAATPLSAQPPAEESGGHRMRVFGDFKGVAGEITEIKGDTLVLKTEQGTAIVKTTDKTVFRRDGGAAKLSDFKVGDRVMVGGDPGPNNTWTAAFVGIRGTGGPGGMARGEFSPDQMGKKFVFGEVLKIDGTKITLKRPDGVEQTIEVDEDTSFRKSRTESVTLADIKVGDRVGGRGELKNGVFVPSMLNVGMPPGGPGHRNTMQGQPTPPPLGGAASPGAADTMERAPKEDGK